MKKPQEAFLFLLGIALTFSATAQQDSLPTSRITDLEQKIKTLELTELVQSMSQRSLLTPSYFFELKALVARQAYNFWKENNAETYVSHLNIYHALYYANKYLGYDSVNQIAYNQALGHNESVVSLKFGQKPSIFYSAGSDGKVLKWDLSNLKGVPETIYKGNHLIKSIEVSHDEKWIMIVTKDQGLIFLPSESTPEQLANIARDPEPVQTAIFLPGQSRYLTVNNRGELKIKGELLSEETIGITTKKVFSVAIDPTNNDIFTGQEDGTVSIWSDTLERDLYFKESFAINTLAVSPDQQLLAMGREKGDVILWDLKKKELLRVISGHQSAITDVDFSPDNQRLLTASRDATVRLWYVNDPRKFPIVLDDHEDWVMTACFDPSGKLVISGSKDNYIRVWPTNPDELADRICRLVGRNLTEEEWKEYVGSHVSYGKTCPN